MLRLETWGLHPASPGETHNPFPLKSCQWLGGWVLTDARIHRPHLFSVSPNFLYSFSCKYDLLSSPGLLVESPKGAQTLGEQNSGRSVTSRQYLPRLWKTNIPEAKEHRSACSFVERQKPGGVTGREAQCLAPGGHSIIICWMNEWVKKISQYLMFPKVEHHVSGLPSNLVLFYKSM